MIIRYDVLGGTGWYGLPEDPATEEPCWPVFQGFSRGGRSGGYLLYGTSNIWEEFPVRHVWLPEQNSLFGKKKNVVFNNKGSIHPFVRGSHRGGLKWGTQNYQNVIISLKETSGFRLSRISIWLLKSLIWHIPLSVGSSNPLRPTPSQLPGRTVMSESFFFSCMMVLSFSSKVSSLYGWPIEGQCQWWHENNIQLVIIAGFSPSRFLKTDRLTPINGGWPTPFHTKKPRNLRTNQDTADSPLWSCRQSLKATKDGWTSQDDDMCCSFPS